MKKIFVPKNSSIALFLGWAAEKREASSELSSSTAKQNVEITQKVLLCDSLTAPSMKFSPYMFLKNLQIYLKKKTLKKKKLLFW